MSRSMMTGLSAILGAGGGGGISGANTLLTGGSDYANVTDSATLQFSTAMTIAAYVNIDTTGGKQTIISKDDGGSDGYELYYDTIAGKFKGHIYIGAAIKEVESAITPLAGVWYNVALWHDGTNLKIYVDGVQSGIVSAIGSTDTNTAVFRIGASSTIIATNVFNGSIALVMGWNDDLTPAELNEIVTPKDPSLYTQQAFMQIGLPLNGKAKNPASDTTGNNNNAVLVNGADYTGVKLAIEQVSGPAEADYNTFGFDSTSKYVTIPSFSVPSGSLALMAWAKNGASASGQDRLFRLESPSLILTIETNGRVSAVHNANAATGTTGVRDDTWHLIGLNFDGSNVSVWIDGQQDTSTSSIATSFSDTLYIGRNHVNDSHFTGSLTTPMLFTKALSAGEWASLYAMGKTPYYETLPSSLTSDCIMALEMSSRDNSLDDLSGNGNNGTANGGVTDDGDLQTFTSYS